jgi:hypothetical protein
VPVPSFVSTWAPVTCDVSSCLAALKMNSQDICAPHGWPGSYVSQELHAELRASLTGEERRAPRHRVVPRCTLELGRRRAKSCRRDKMCNPALSGRASRCGAPTPLVPNGGRKTFHRGNVPTWGSHWPHEAAPTMLLLESCI